LSQMIPLPLATWERLIAWLAVGMLIYFFYGVKHSKVNEGRTWAPLGKVRVVVGILSVVFLSYVMWAHFLK